MNSPANEVVPHTSLPITMPVETTVMDDVVDDIVKDSADDIGNNLADDVVVPTCEGETNEVNEQDATDIPMEEILGQDRRSKKAFVRLRDYVVDTISGTAPSSSLVSTSPTPQPSSGTVYPIVNFVSCIRFSPNHRRFLMALTVSMEPRSFFEAMKDERWGKVVDVELDSLISLNTWRLEHLPPGKLSAVIGFSRLNISLTVPLNVIKRGL
ncbi:unnamed protein product [Microthlaspi erraticum]|uniref:Uncharacterized protein n=1 Tax=Microthlaspi erraticum TaxID=1685480 RepID=A0A6D2IW67_9BRAS|nr:unnamed protein product [Microthlaspi erraticum]